MAGDRADAGRAGAADTLIPEPHARTYAAEIPGATYREIEQAAHMVMVERPDALATAIVEFAPPP